MKRFVSRELKFIEKRRKECGIEIMELIAGICSKSHYSEMKNSKNKRLPNKAHINDFIRKLNITSEELELWCKYGNEQNAILIIEQVDKMLFLARNNKPKELQQSILKFEKVGSCTLIETVGDNATLKKILLCKAFLKFSNSEYSDAIKICEEAIELTIDNFNFYIYKNIKMKVNLFTNVDIECILLEIQTLIKSKLLLIT